MFHCNTLKKEGRAFAFAFRNIGKYIPVLCNQPCQFSYSNLVNLRLLVSYLETWSHFLASPLPYYYYWSQTSVEMAFFLFRLLHTPLVPVADSKREVVMTNICCLQGPTVCSTAVANSSRSSKFKANLIQAIDFASVDLFTVTYLELCLARKCETRKTCKQTVKIFPYSLITWSLNSSSRYDFFWLTRMKHGLEKRPLQQTSGINIISMGSCLSALGTTLCLKVCYLQVLLWFAIFVFNRALPPLRQSHVVVSR